MLLTSKGLVKLRPLKWLQPKTKTKIYFRRKSGCVVDLSKRLVHFAGRFCTEVSARRSLPTNRLKVNYRVVVKRHFVVENVDAFSKVFKGICQVALKGGIFSTLISLSKQYHLSCFVEVVISYNCKQIVLCRFSPETTRLKMICTYWLSGWASES